MQMKKYLCAGLVLTVLMLCSGCFRTYNMPFNGEIVFHDFSLTIPEDYIRDSTQSNDDLWSFEKGWYKKVIIIKRSDVSENEPEQLRELMEFYESIGIPVTLAQLDIRLDDEGFARFQKEIADHSHVAEEFVPRVMEAVASVRG